MNVAADFFLPRRGQLSDVIESQSLVKRIVKWAELIRKLKSYILLGELSPKSAYWIIRPSRHPAGGSSGIRGWRSSTSTKPLPVQVFPAAPVKPGVTPVVSLRERVCASRVVLADRMGRAFMG
jgi:hypothetical protein